MKKIILRLCVPLVFAALASAQTWTQVTQPGPFQAAGTALLLTDGTVMVQAVTITGYGTGQWWRLTPDANGNYINGTWSPLANMPPGYAPLYYASAVLSDGRVVVEGGEYNGQSVSPDEVNLGAIYTPPDPWTVGNSWTSIAAPPGWSHIGDAQSVVLENGTFMLGNCGYSGGTSKICTPFQRQQALLDESTLTWTLVGNGKADDNSEEGWTLLPQGSVLTVDAENGTNSEIYNPGTKSWSSAGSTVAPLPDTACYNEVGPAVLRPDGTVFAIGGNGNTAIYNSATHQWSVGLTLPSGLTVADGPAALLPDGNVLVDASPFPIPNGQGDCLWPNGSQFFEYDGISLIPVPAPPNANYASYVGSMLLLPTGQVLFTHQSNDVEVYTPSGTYASAWQPTISNFPSWLTPGIRNYSISGTQFNGLSQGAMYGDDAQAATNYPLVRITNNSTGHVFYCKTHSHSTMGVATGTATVSTWFDVPFNVELGASQLVVVANGIPSDPVNVNVQPPLFSLTATPMDIITHTGRGLYTISVNDLNGFNGTVALSCTTNGFSQCWLNPVSIVGNGNSTLRVYTDSDGENDITVTGTGRGFQQSVSVTLTLQCQGTSCW